jgi:6-phosphofructokinase 2
MGIATLTLNPALDVTTAVASVEPDVKLRGAAARPGRRRPQRGADDRIARRPRRRGSLQRGLPPGVPEDACGRLARRVARTGGRLVLDTNGRALERALGAGLHAIKPNWRELDQLAGATGPLDDGGRRALAARLVADGAAEAVIVTLGDRGALVTTAGEQIELAAPRVAVVSAVGCGDAFAGALLMGLERGWPLIAACRLGVAAAAAAVGTQGTAPPSRADVERLDRNLPAGV